MTMTDPRPPIPALMGGDEPPVTDAGLDRLAELRAAFPADFAAVLEYAAGMDPDDLPADPAPGEQSWAWVQAKALVIEHPDAARFAVNTPELAEWALRKRAEALAQKAEAQALYDGWKAELDGWLATATAGPASTIAYMDGHLVGFLRAYRAETGAKSLTLPSGRLASTSSKAAPAIEDQEALLAWAEALPEAIRDGDLSPIKRTAEVQISRLAKLVQVHELAEPITEVPEGGGEPVVTGYSTRYVVTTKIDPETGAAWPEDFDPLKHAVPGAMVKPATVTYRVEQ